jgi:SSS family solute:Na+ symporter
LAEVLHVAGGWSFTSCLLLTSTVVMVNVLIGGFRGTMRTEVLHFFFMVAGLLPMLFLSQHRGNAVQRWGTQLHAWRMTPVVSNNAPVDLLGVVVGLGLVIGFSYWCTDFLMMQRALAARTAESARRVPLYAGFGKLMFGFLVVFPVLRAGHFGAAGQGALDQTAPLLMRSLYAPKLLALGMIALVASLMTGVVANVSAFAALWTQEIYRTAVRPGKIERHYIRMGRGASIVCIVLSLGGALATLWFESLSQFLLAIFSLSLVPFFAVILASVTSRRCSTRNVMVAVLAGVGAGCAGQVAYALQWLHAGSQLNANFRIAIAVFATTFGLCLAMSEAPREDERREDDVARLAGKASISPSLYFLAALLVSCCLLCNVIWF